MKRRWLIGVGVFVSLCLAVLPAPAASQYNNLAAAQGNWLRGYIDVPAGRMWLSLESRFGTGDCDLYLRYGAAPTTSSYLKRSVRNATNLEYLRVDNPAAGRYYFGIYAYRTFSRVSFRAEWANTAYNWYTDMRNRVNRERTQYNLVLLTLNSQLNTAAGRHATAMASKNFFSHNDPYDGSTPTTRIRAAGYMTGWSTWTIAENIHAGTDCWYPHYAMDAWMRSATHRANILNPAFRHLGAGRAYNAASTYKYYWCQTFGNRY